MKRLILIFGVAALFSCTENQKARSLGGNESIDLPEGYSLVNSTWKGQDLWILAINNKTGETLFYEKSSWGLLEGSITFKNSSTEKDTVYWKQVNNFDAQKHFK
jgi:hypothetical protein